MTKHEYSWCTAEWDTLPETLQNLEKEGWFIFAVVPIGTMDRFLKVIYRRPGIIDRILAALDAKE
jgi:hypothetical protein